MIVALMDSLHQGLQGSFRANDLTPPLAMTLKLLDQPHSMRALADAHQCDASNITGIVDRLERRGLVGRHADPSDRRVTLITRTPEGDELRRQLSDAAIAGLSGMDGLTDDELEALIALLGKLVDSPPAG
jgi:DNA-binding MarR family transcriptional regulator